MAFPDPAGDQLVVLAAEVQNENQLFHTIFPPLHSFPFIQVSLRSGSVTLRERDSIRISPFRSRIPSILVRVYAAPGVIFVRLFRFFVFPDARAAVP